MYMYNKTLKKLLLIYQDTPLLCIIIKHYFYFKKSFLFRCRFIIEIQTAKTDMGEI